jgi:hypothetical protein
MDSEILFPLIPFLLSPVILGIVIYFAIRTASANKKKLDIMARELGLKKEMADQMKEFSENNKAQQSLINFVFMLADPVFTGEFEGSKVRIHFEKRGGKNKTIYSVIDLIFEKPLSVDLSVSHEGLLGRLADFLGMKDVQVDDPVLDPLLRIRAHDERSAKIFLLEAGHKEAMIRLFSKYDNVQMDQNGFHFEKKGYITEASQIREILSDLSDAVRRLNS